MEHCSVVATAAEATAPNSTTATCRRLQLGSEVSVAVAEFSISEPSSANPLPSRSSNLLVCATMPNQ